MADLKSTVSGTVLDVLVKVGGHVNIDDDLVLIESMKMEIPVAAERAGTIVEILVARGDAVREGETLLRLG